jgi:hypothetical protein
MRSMPPLIDQTLFSEPSGRPLGLVFLCGALLLAGQQGYYIIIEGAAPFYATLLLSSGWPSPGLPSPCRPPADGKPVSCDSRRLPCW